MDKKSSKFTSEDLNKIFRKKEYSSIGFEEELVYYLKNYGNRFYDGQGLELIMDKIKEKHLSGSWCDLGGGSNTMLWLLATDKIYEVDIFDSSLESMILQSILVQNKIISPCMSYFEERYSVSLIHKTKTTKFIYNQLELLHKDIVLSKEYNIITQFGLLGLCHNRSMYLKKCSEIIPYLCNKGTFIGVNWIFTKEYSKVRGINNSFIGCELVKEIAKVTSTYIIFNEYFRLNDEKYTGFIFYILGKDKEKFYNA